MRLCLLSKKKHILMSKKIVKMVIICNYVLGGKKKSGYTTKGIARRGKYLHGKLVH